MELRRLFRSGTYEDVCACRHNDKHHREARLMDRDNPRANHLLEIVLTTEDKLGEDPKYLGGGAVSMEAQ